jgi:hypothetical protein
VLARTLTAVRRLPETARPSKIYGCEVWRDLDWLPDSKKIAFPVGERTDLQEALNRVFASQITGGKRYDLAVMGRRLAHATFHESHSADKYSGVTFAVDLTPLALDDSMSLEDFTQALISRFSEEVRINIRNVSQSSHVAG